MAHGMSSFFVSKLTNLKIYFAEQNPRGFTDFCSPPPSNMLLFRFMNTILCNIEKPYYPHWSLLPSSLVFKEAASERKETTEGNQQCLHRDVWIKTVLHLSYFLKMSIQPRALTLNATLNSFLLI